MEHANEQIRKMILDQLAWDCRVDHSDITVEVNGHKAALFGKVNTHFERQAAENDARMIPGVSSVENHLIVNHLGEKRDSDEQIKWNLKSVFALNASFEDAEIEVAVDNGIVTLSGSVDQYYKKKRAEELSLNIPGVNDIVDKIAVVPNHVPYDRTIAMDIVGAISRIGKVDVDSINVEVNGGRVVLNGKVPDWGAYSSIHNIAKFMRGVTELTNNLVIV
jgi:osmotically-inducible protein OsmY